MSELEFLRLIKQSLRSAQEDAPAVRPVADLVGGRILEIERATVPQKAVAPGMALDDRVVFKDYLKECDDCAIVPDVAGAFNFAWQRATCSQALPFGWKLVPVEPTNAMLGALVHKYWPADQIAGKELQKAQMLRGGECVFPKTEYEIAVGQYQRMLAAAPQAPDSAQVAEDAARYRWLRDPDMDVALVLDKQTGYVPIDDRVPSVGGYHTYEYRAGEELDAAIDAARAAAKGQEGSAR